MNDTVGQFHFHSNFDSGNLARVEKSEKNDNEFNLWTTPDCANTPFENGNRTWFYFGVKGPCSTTVKFNIMNLNRQAKLYSQGMKPLFKIIPYQEQWERIKEKPICSVEEQSFVLSFKFTMPAEADATAYLAFCYPYSYSELLSDLDALEARFAAKEASAVFFKRDLLCLSLEQRRLDLLTVTRNGDENRKDKPVVFVSARVHPGETPSSFVLKGFLDFILKEDDLRAQRLREKFHFLLVPMLNPDGVARGHYRTDSRGINLNRVYLETNPELHPTIAATKQLLLDIAKEELPTVEISSMYSLEQQVKDSLIMPTDDSNCLEDSITHWPMTFNQAEGGRTSFAGLQFPAAVEASEAPPVSPIALATVPSASALLNGSILEGAEEADVSVGNFDVAPVSSTSNPVASISSQSSSRSRLFAYIDLHGHASKRGIFIYGNHFKDAQQQVECVLMPKLISLNSQHFDFWACNFTEKNMRQRDKRDGLSKEGSGRVAISKLTGISRSYTLECNYNTGRMRNVLSPLPTDKYQLFHATTGDTKAEEGPTVSSRRRTVSAGPNLMDAYSPPVPYNQQSFEEVGEAMAVSLLDLIGTNPLSRLPQSTYSDVDGVRQWIRLHCLGQRRFPFIENELEDEMSAGCSHLTSSVTTNNKSEPSQQSTNGGQYGFVPDGAGSESNINKKNSATKNPSKSMKAFKEGVGVQRKPWPASPARLNKDPSSPNRSPKQGGASVDPVVSFNPASPSYQPFPKVTTKSPLITARRLPRKKSLKKAKAIVKKDVLDVDGELEPIISHSPASPPKLLKRKRRKSRTVSETSTSSTSLKEKRKYAAAAAAAAAEQHVHQGVSGADPDALHSQPSTSTSSSSKSSGIIKKKLIKKKRLVPKKKRCALLDVAKP